MNESVELIAAMAGLSLPFFVLLLSIEKHVAEMKTVLALCPNCPKVK